MINLVFLAGPIEILGAVGVMLLKWCLEPLIFAGACTFSLFGITAMLVIMYKCTKGTL